MRFAYIAAEKAQHHITTLCRNLRVSPSGYYAWACRPRSAHAQQDEILRVQIRASFTASRQTYGSPRVHRDLRDLGHRVSRKRVVRLMQAEHLRGRAPKRFKVTTQSDPTATVPANLLAREFVAEAPNQRWVGDTTECVVGERGRLYLAVLIDLYSRMVVGWAISATNDRHLTLRALESALLRRGPVTGLLHHTDQGTTYTSEAYQARLAQAGMVPSMSRRGDCYDNAVSESFFATLKTELGEHFGSFAEARMHLFDYIEVFYNQRRRHSTIGLVSPAVYERQWVTQAA
jgi:transposase InsO family protein